METVVEKNNRPTAAKQGSYINTIIIGASAAGLASAACLGKKKIPYLLLEGNDHVAGSWRAHYDRLHLNTEKWNSHLPYLPFPPGSSTYLSRDEVVKYMEDYADTFGIQPLFNQHVKSVSRIAGQWLVETNQQTWRADHIIIATGNNRRPVSPAWPGMESFKGQVFHSSVYKNGGNFKGRQVLVVGFGSSACEIAICLHEHGAFPSMSVQGKVNVVPRDAGSPVVSRLLHKLAFLSRQFPEWVDKLVVPKLRKKYRFLPDFGLHHLPYGPNTQIVRHKRVPVLDIGTMELIKKGYIKIYPGIKSFTSSGVRFTDGREENFDAVVLATGFHPHVKEFLQNYQAVTDTDGRPLISGAESALPGLYFCGFSVSPYGMLNQIGREARQIAKAIARSEKKKASTIDADLSNL
jgi:cation diffusion facilitator CzcD-associated flavoprotein CzcO